MAHANVVTWTCDRCGRRTVERTSEKPKGWVLIEMESLVDPDGVNQAWEICDGCANQHSRFMLGQKASIDE